MRKGFMILPLLAVWAGSALAQGSGASSSTPSIRPVGVVTKIQAGSLTLHTDAGPDLLIQLGDGVSFLRVPPGATNLNTATKITMSDISSGDRVLVRGRVSEDQKSILATAVIVMTKSDLASAREAERLDWQRRGIGGTVQAVNPETKEITVLSCGAIRTRKFLTGGLHCAEGRCCFAALRSRFGEIQRRQGKSLRTNQGRRSIAGARLQERRWRPLHSGKNCVWNISKPRGHSGFGRRAKPRHRRKRFSFGTARAGANECRFEVASRSAFRGARAGCAQFRGNAGRQGRKRARRRAARCAANVGARACAWILES